MADYVSKDKMKDEQSNILYDYESKQWQIGDPITQSRMNYMDEGIETIFARIKDYAKLGGYNGTMQSLYNALNSQITQVSEIATTAANSIERATANTTDGRLAWLALTGAEVAYDPTAANGQGAFTKTLSEILGDKADVSALTTQIGRIDNIEAAIGESGDNPTGLYKLINKNIDDISKINSAITAAKDPNIVDDTLNKRFTRIEEAASLTNSNLSDLNNGGKGIYGSLAERLNAIDNSTSGFRTLPAVDTEVINARGKDENDNDYSTLSLRLSANDTKVTNIKATADNAVPKANVVHDLVHSGTYEVLGADQGAAITNNIANAKSEAIASANTYADTKIADTKIADNLTTDTTGYVLGAGQGKALNTRLSAVETEIAAAHVSSAIRTNDSPTTFSNGLDERFENIEGIGVAVKNEIEDAHRTNLGVDENTGLPIQDTLRTRFEAIESAAAASDSAIDGRLDALEDNVNGAKVQDGPQTLDARFDAIEDRANQLETNVNIIATELDMVDTNGLKTIGTRVDNLAADISAFATELDMARDQTGALVDTNTRVDTIDVRVTDIESELNAARIQIGIDENEDPIMGTLDDRFDAIDTKISHAVDAQNNDAGGLTERIEALETSIDTAETGLLARMTAAEGDIDDLEDVLNHENTGVIARLDALDVAETGAIAGLDGRIGTLEDTINTANTGLSARMNNAESAITTLQNEPKSATVIITSDKISYNAETGAPTIYSDSTKETAVTPSTTVDYLLQNGDKYYYWKYIQTGELTYSWEKIAGSDSEGNGTGSSSGMFIESLDVFEGEDALTPDENIDYFVGTNNIGYTHYRYLVPEGAEIGTFVRILPKGLLQNVGVTANGGLVGYTVENSSTNVFNNFVAFKDVDAEPVMDGQTQTGTKLTFTDTNGVGHAVTVSGGGGAGSAYTVKLNNETGSLSLTVPDTEGQVTTVSARALVKEGTDIAENLSSILTVTTQYSTSRDGPWSTLESRMVENNTPFSVDVSSILRTGIKMYVRLTLTTRLDEQDFTRPITYEITKVEMSIAATNFNPAVVRTGNLVFQYKCIGSGLEKTVHFKIDGADAVTPVVTDSHNEPLQQTIPLVGREVGMHSFEVYFTVGNVSSNILNYYILYNNDTTNTLPMIALAAEKATITYGDELKINYTTAVNSNVEFMDNVLLELYTIDSETDQEVPITHTELTNVRNERVHPWIPVDYPTEGTVYIRGTASRTIDDQVYTYTKTISITVNKLITKYSLTYAGEDNLLYSYTAYGRTNQDLGKEVFNYTYTSQDIGNPTITWTGAFNNFNWATDGYVDGQTLTISGGATHTIDVPLFDSKKGDISLEVDPKAYTDPTQNGRTIEIEYEVQSATDLNDTIIDCMDNNHVGFRVTPQSCYLLNNNVNVSFANDGTGTILNEDAIAAAYLTTGVRTHLAFVIEPWAEEKAYDKKYHQSVNIYINGEFANACPYNRDNSTGNISDSFKTNATIRIGSASCIIKIYSIKMYNRGLTNTEILQNYKMAPGKTRDKLARFENNDVLEGGAVDYELARKKFNCLLLVGPQPEIRQNDQGQDYNAMPTISPYKGAPSPIGRVKDGEVVGKTESGLILTYPDGNSIDGYKTEFSLLDMMSDGGYASSNNVQGTSSQKYPIHNLKVYLMKGTAGKEVYDTTVDILTRNVNASSITAAATAAYRSVYPLPEVVEGEEVEEINTELPEYITNCAEAIAQTVQSSTELMTQAEVVTAIINYLTNEDAAVGAAYTSTGDELVINHPFIGYSKSEKVKYKLPGSKGKGESTLCWKADYMSTDHANTYNANIADSLFTDSLNPNITNEDWQTNVQNTVHGIRCLLFKQEGTNPPEFVSDGCLNNDKGNSKTYGLEYTGDDGANTTAQKWEFTNNSDDLGFFKYDCVFYPTGNDNHYRALDAFESCFPDQGDLEDAQDAYKAEHNNEEDPNLNPNYNHLQVLLTWVSQRANYWEETDPTLRAQKKEIFRTEFTRHFNLDHVLVYYLFSEYTALCDNRVKNMFMRSDTIRSERIKLLNGDTVFEGNANPNADFWKTYTSITTRGINTGSIVSAINAAYAAIHENDEVEEGEEPPTEAAFAEAFANSISAAAQESENILTEEQVIALIKSELAELEDEDAATIATMYDTYSDGKEVVIEHRVRDANLIDWETGEEHSNFAIWAPVLYDLDSCFGVENVGLLKIPYNADWQYFSEGQYRFNGHDSIFWLMVEDTFQSELAAKALTLYNRSRGLNYNTFYQEQVVDNVNETAPAMTNQDMILKYDVPWATGFMNYANTPPTYETPEYKYLQRGTRTAQKTSFLFQRSMLLSSKYQASAFLNDKISFRYGADLSAAQGIIECTANQIMYPAVSFGDNKGWTQALELADGTPVVNGLVQAGQKCRIRATSSAKGQDTLFIAGASVLTDIGDLSVFKPYELKVGQGKNLKKLIIGSNASGYTNAVTSTIENLSACSILEEINIRNCTAFTNLDVSANGLIKRIYAAGSGAGTISLPSGGVLTDIEYSVATSNVTILNHGYLQTCTFEIEDGEETPQYSNLNKLWVENTPNVPVVDMVIKRMGSLTNGLRLVGIDVDLGNDPTFLQTITSTLADGKYLDSAGSLNTSETPWIAGKVHISEIRASLLNKIHNMYPELIVYNVIDNEGNVSNNIVAEYSVEYQNYDGTILYTDNRTNTENYIDPVFDTNPITGEPYISMPTKPADAQYKYRFGTYNARTGKYNRYSGWVRKGTDTNPNSSQTVNGNTVFVAVYPTTEIQTYTVTWYDKYNGTARQEITVNYGIDLSSEPSPIELGTMQKVDQSGNQVKVFTGWSRPLGKIVEDVNVYALWQSSGINENTEDIDMSALTAADLYALSLISNEKKSELLSEKLGQPIFIPMGYDFDYQEGANVINLMGNESELLFDGSSDYIRVYNGTGGNPLIKPLATNSDWTLAIDYKFLMDSVNSYASSPEFVLASCYKNANSTINGFKLSLLRGSDQTNPTIQISWGNQTQTIDYAVADAEATRYFTSYRNVVVLSHNSDRPNVLRVSYVLPNTSNGQAPYGANYGTFVSNTELTYTTSPIDTPIILGGNYSGATTEFENSEITRAPAQGIIYWAKYWDTDLGEDGCSKLASWPHETVPFYLSGYNGTAQVTEGTMQVSRTMQIYANSELSFVAAQGMGDRYLYASYSSSNYTNGYFGWRISDGRSICNNVIYKGIPEAYKSIIKLSTIKSAERDPDTDASAEKQYEYFETQDYLFFPAYREVESSATALGTYGAEVRTQWNSPWLWMVPANINILEYASGSTTNLEYKTASSMNIYRYRFLGAYIDDNAKIFNITDDPATKLNLRIQQSGQASIAVELHSGDIWIKNNIAYMYFTQDQIDTGITVDIIVNNNTYQGGWKRCDMWNLRTYSNQVINGSENSFLRITVEGNIDSAPTRSQYREYGRLLCPEFTI